MGGRLERFTIKAASPTAKPVPEIRPQFVASQVHLSYSTTGANGAFAPVPLTGTTIKDGAILGWVGPVQGITLAPNSTTAYTFNVTLASYVPVSRKKPMMAFESYMDQINPVDGTGSTLNDTSSTRSRSLPRHHRTTPETS